MNTWRNVGRAREGGAVTVLYAGMLVLILGMCGLALDLGMAYLRQTRLQNVADNIALGAALRLNGRADGAAAAVAVAADRAAMVWDSGSGLWSADALRFSDTADAPESGWVDAAAAIAAPAGKMYARVDIGQLPDVVRQIQPVLSSVLASATTLDVRPRAVAGRRGMRLLPFAICAMGAETATRDPGGSPELVNYGFRYGVTYNLLMLNTTGAATGEYFLVNPLATPDTTTDTTALADDAVGPFMCSGTIAYPRVTGGRVHVRRPGSFTMWRQLNSRFEEYEGDDPCNRLNGPPDTNIRSFVGTGNTWQTPVPTRASAKTWTVNGKLATIADVWPAQAFDPVEYGTRWAFGPARNPDGSNKAAASWTTLYPGTSASTGSPPSGTPYRANITLPAQRPTARAWRRLFYVPLLQCPVTAGQYAEATVLAYGKFFLTAKASASELPGEFAGYARLDAEGLLADDAELVQ